jgi:hypothetical protein
MHLESFRPHAVLWIIFWAIGLSLLPISLPAHHEVGEAQKLVEQSIRQTFDDFNKDDYMGFIDGWTDLGFLNKALFVMHVDRPVPKDEVRIFFGAMKLMGNIELLKVSNVKILDHMTMTATAEIDILQGNVRERYELKLVKRAGLDKRYKIAKDKRLPLYPDGFPVVDVKMTEYAFEFDKSRVGRNMVLKLANAGRTVHEFVLFQIMPVGYEHSVARGAWMFEPGQTNDVVLAGLEPGNYAMVCCVTDPDHKAHCDKGMRTEFAIN